MTEQLQHTPCNSLIVAGQRPGVAVRNQESYVDKLLRTLTTDASSSFKAWLTASSDPARIKKGLAIRNVAGTSQQPTHTGPGRQQLARIRREMRMRVSSAASPRCFML